jgi:hypothetical protein
VRARAQGNLITHVAPPAGAPEPTTKKFKYSAYEQYSVDAALRDLHLEIEPEPENKIVESIESVRLEVFEKRDPVPGFLNVFHTVTRPHVIDRVYHQALADETQRNLAQLMQLSLVLVIATKGTTPGKVRILVITKDVWSIRLQWDIALTNGGLEHLTLNPAETNLAGLHHNLGARFDYLPESSSLGARYVVPRLFGTRVAALVDGNVVLNNRTGSPEGTFGQVTVRKPLWSALTEWEWGAGVSWRYEITRRYRNAQQAQFALDPGTICAQTPERCVPWRYRSDLVTAGADLTRSFGWEHKHDFTLGVEGRHRSFHTDDLSAKDPATVAQFVRTRVPMSDDRIGPYVQYRTYDSNYLRVLDLESLALQEDFSVGLGAYVRGYPILRALGSTRDVFGVSMGVQYTLPLKDGFVRVGGETVAELQVDKGAISDGSASASARLATPRAKIGRLVFDAYVLPEPPLVARRRHAPPRLPDGRVRRRGRRGVQPRVSLAARAALPVGADRWRRVLRRRRRVRRLAEPAPEAHHRLRRARPLPAARSHRLSRRPRLPALVDAAPGRDEPGLVLRHVRSGVQRPRHRAEDRRHALTW